MTIKLIATAGVAVGDGTLDQLQVLGQGNALGQGVHEAAQETGAETIAVAATGMGSQHSKATALIDIAITTNHETVANVIPTIGVHVVVLDASDH